MENARERAETLLSERYATDIIDTDELERRLDALQAANGLAEIRAVTKDLTLPTGSNNLPAATNLTSPTAIARPVEVEATQDIVSILSEQKQVGAWVPAEVNRVITVLGGSTIDLREAVLGPGITRLVVRCILGEIQVVVPPGLDVHVETHAVLANIELPDREKIVRPGPQDPRVVLSGLVVLGSVEIHERHVGESKRDAKRRRKNQRKKLAQGRS